MRNAIAAATALALVCSSTAATHAFCGFYVSGSDKKMFNDATNVVLMRAGTRTVLSMQNDYRGPLENFAMVIPVPVVLKPTDVRVVPKAAFDKVDSLSSPRLVEYWEQDPCPSAYDEYALDGGMPMGVAPPLAAPTPAPAPAQSVSASDKAGRVAERPAVPPILASFAMHPGTVTAGLPTNLTFSYAFSNEPWPPPSCTVDHGVGATGMGMVKPVSIEESTTFTLTCANSAGKSTKAFKVNAVKIEAQFDVEEYQIVILSAKEAAGLNDWLKINGYKIPEGAEPLLRPYVESGSKFFVAKVDPAKVKMVDGRVALSPLRFHYDSEDFSLPIRLGMANSSGKQDLIVNIISPDKRYEVANYKNVMIPTNFNVLPLVKDRFAEFYAALFDKTLEANPGAVVTEYAWTSQPTPQWGGGAKCDPCPPVIPDDKDIVLLGGDIIGGNVAKGGMVLTRLHARYGAKDMKDDLRFSEAKPITGGREVMNGAMLETGATPSAQNFFQARYAVRHWWTGPVKCSSPRRQVWGGPPHGIAASPTKAAQKTAFAPRGGFALATVVGRDLWEIGLRRTVPAPAAPKATVPTTPKKSVWLGLGALAGLAMIGVGALRSRRRDDEL
ncbi:MAG: DUF2330 domain-containing protein [Deltaproteobacteria bacterium]|nr:DUF2330 domain-containing protein [Deltaproteobacteria bacterium]